jgi:hypothetical protein
MPERRDHLRVGFKVVRQDHYGEAGYSDVVVRSQGTTQEKIEEGEYTIHAPGRGIRVLELRSGDAVRRYLALGQPGLGRFRFISYD